MAMPCQAGKGEVDVEMLYPQQHDPAGRNATLRAEDGINGSALRGECPIPAVSGEPHSPQGHPAIPETSSGARGISPR